MRKFKWVADDLAIANTSFYFYKRLLHAQKHGYRRELRKSQEFWGYTQRAHCITALIYLCRVYDTYRNQRPGRDPFHLLRLVEEIDESKLSGAERKQRQADLEFLQKEDTAQKRLPDPRVAKLRKWRNNLLSHSNQDMILGGLNNFRELNPLTTEEIQKLVNEGLSIIERWALQHGVLFPIKRLAQERGDYLFVLESLRLGLRQQKK